MAKKQYDDRDGLCSGCKKKVYTEAVKVCPGCNAQETNSVFKRCATCARARNKCSACGKKVF